MLKLFKGKITATFLLFLIISPFFNVYADLSPSILEGINNGTRTIRSEITSLKTIPVPEPSTLNKFIKNKKKVIELGKALFWDMQMGSDGIQACASCHFSAGADNRAKNQLNPGLRKVNQDASPNPDKSFSSGRGPNYHLKKSDFPFHVKSDANLFTSNVIRDTNDVTSSLGIHFSLSTGIVVIDPEGFQINGINTRRVEPRNTPTVINAVFNHRNFWDGRASNIFNGVNGLGDRDPYAFVYKAGVSGKLKAVKVRIDNASLASQAVGPPISSFEMSTDGRTWTEIGHNFIARRGELSRKKGKRVLRIRPLAKQKVHPQDSVLGYMSRRFRPGLKVRSYKRMIRKAFKPRWWKSRKFIHINKDGSRRIVSRPIDENSHSQMEMNFSLFFGLAVQMYQATLVSDDSPVDRFLEGDKNALSESELIGFHIADDEGRCLNCHGRGEFTFAAVSRVKERGLTRIRRGDLIDEGFNNIGVRPTLDDLGIGGVDAMGNPLGFARLTHLGKFDNKKIPGINDELAADLGNDGAFKIPTLRNVELTAPYFHNGGVLTLENVINFYFRGGDFRTFNTSKNHPVIGFDANRTNQSEITGLGVLRGTLLNSGPGLDDADRANIVAFLKALTDERVRYAKAPFDHPQLFVPNGHPGDQTNVTDNGAGNATDNMLEIPAVGRNGGTPLPTFLENLAN